MWRLAVSRRVLVLTLAASAGAGIGAGTLSACSSGGASGTGTVPAAATAPLSPSTTSLSPSPSPASAPAAGGPVTADQASAIAVQASPGTVTEVDQDVEAAGPVFDVTIRRSDGTETKVEVATNTGQILSTETQDQDDAR
jgi:hypothetical protein